MKAIVRKNGLGFWVVRQPNGYAVTCYHSWRNAINFANAYAVYGDYVKAFNYERRLRD